MLRTATAMLRCAAMVLFFFACDQPTFNARASTLAPEDQLHVKTIVAKLTRVKGGRHGFSNNASVNMVLPSTAAGTTTAASTKELRPPPTLSIDPPYFDYGSHYTCISVSHDFEMTSLSQDNHTEPVKIYSVTISSLHFHVSNFGPTVLAPNGTKTFKIMFLPYVEGPVAAVVVVQTSIGGFLVRLAGEGVDNPYGVVGFTSVRVPMGIAYNPAVQVYNPFAETLLIKEIFTTEGFLHLTLPDFVHDVDKVEEVNAVSTSASIWQVRPREIKDVIELSFRSHTPGPYRGFLHIKTNLDNLVVPIDIVVLQGGIHAMPEQLHFGATVPGEVHTIPVTLLNSDRVPVAILDVSTRNTDDAISVAYRSGFVLPPQKSMSGAINVSLGRRSWQAGAGGGGGGFPEGERSGFIVIRTNQTGNAITKIPYSALFLRGSIGFDPEQFKFPLFAQAAVAATAAAQPEDSASKAVGETTTTNSNDDNATMAKTGTVGVSSSQSQPLFTNRTIELVNNFGIPLTMQSITLPDSHFGVNGLRVGSVAHPGEAWPAFSLHFMSRPRRLMYNTTLILHTNVTLHRIPIQVYHGLLDITTEPNPVPVLLLDVPNDGSHANANNTQSAQKAAAVAAAAAAAAEEREKYFIDFGVVATNETRRRILNLSNPNPTPITVYRISKSWRSLHLRLAGIYLDGATESANSSQHKGYGLFVLQPRALTSFVVILKAPTRARSAQSKAVINFYTSSGQIRVGAKYVCVCVCVCVFACVMTAERIVVGRLVGRSTGVLGAIGRRLALRAFVVVGWMRRLVLLLLSLVFGA